MDQSFLKAFGVDKLRFQDVFVFAAFVIAVMLCRVPDSFVLQPSFRFEVKPATDNEKGFLPLPIITDLDGDGINEIVIATREPGIKILMLPSFGPHNKPSVLPHLHTKAEMLLPSKNQTTIEDNKQSNPMPVAMATGCLHKSESDLKSCRQVIVLMTDDSVVYCYNHLLKLLWKAQPLSNNMALEKHFYKEVSMYVDQDSIKGGLIVIGLRIAEEIIPKKEHRHDEMLNNAPKPSLEEIIDKVLKVQDTEVNVEPEDHFSTYALSGLTGRLKWKHEPGDFEKNETTTSKEDILPTYHYKLSLRSSHYHVGELHWSHFSKSLIDNLPHRNNHPSHVQIKVVNFVKDSLRIKGVKQPNAVVIHNEKGVEVLEVTTGRPICHFPSPKATATLADVNQDGVIDLVESIFWAHATHQNDDLIPHCSGVVRTGSNILFAGPICHPTSVFDYVGQPRVYDPEEYGEEPLQLPPLVIEGPPHRSGIFSHLMGRSVRQESDGKDVIFFLSSGKVTSFGSLGEFNWQVDTKASWSSYISGDKYHRGEISSIVQEHFVPDLQAVDYIVAQQRPDAVLLVGWKHVAIISLAQGKITSAHSLPCQPISPVVQGDFSNDDITDFIIHCRTSYLGFVLEREPGYWWTAVLVASGLGIVLTTVFCFHAIEDEMAASSST